ncbi:hypothetical protein [uncultured Olleya sp.]|uniref:hypothetical protein n=1 Tax=uncultured Olleya sp. TaxID=757243 RepID=UPI0025919855|nr:hypothetical protein [uncultured Olleya sp.]
MTTNIAILNLNYYKVFFTLIVGSYILKSNIPQSNFDLTKLSLNKDKINDVITKDTKIKKYPLGNTNNEYISTKAEELLIFNNTSLIGRQNPDSNRGVNGINFYYNKKDSIIYKYQVFIYSKVQAEKLLSALKLKLGEPDYTGYMRLGDKEKEKFSSLLWEEKENNRLYLLNYSLDETEKARLEVKINSSDINELNLTASFSYWEDYLKVRNRKDNPNYTYQDFLDEKLKRDSNDVRAKLSK